jgi:transcriptional regulator of acetoin/glycerol metabolism
MNGSGSHTEAARRRGIGRASLWRKRKEYGV